jgi:hypothetical protein
MGLATGVNVDDLCSGAALEEMCLGWEVGDAGGIVKELSLIRRVRHLQVKYSRRGDALEDGGGVSGE